MTARDEMKETIIKSLKYADNYEIAVCYNKIVSCGICPYWHDCRNEHDCMDYICNKLEGY